jgi:amidophosphoribosyltransferase
LHVNSTDEIAKVAGVDSLGYLGLDKLQKLTLGKNIGFCDACFSGNYPTPIPKHEQEDIDNEVEVRKPPKFKIR